MGIPIISILLAIVSWGQTYMETLEKKQALKEKQQAQQMAEMATAQKEEAVRSQQIMRDEVVQYQETIADIEQEVQALKRVQVASPAYQERIQSIDDRIQKVQEPIREIHGQRYRRISD